MWEIQVYHFHFYAFEPSAQFIRHVSDILPLSFYFLFLNPNTPGFSNNCAEIGVICTRQLSHSSPFQFSKLSLNKGVVEFREDWE